MAHKFVFLLLNCLAIVFLSEATNVQNSQFNSDMRQQVDFDGGVEIQGTRAKRYSSFGKSPLAYMNSNNGYGRNNLDDNVMNQREQRSPPLSSLREFRPGPELSQLRDGEDPNSFVDSDIWEDGVEGPDSYVPYAMARRNFKRSNDEAQLSERDLETLLLLEALNSGPRNPYMSFTDYPRVSRAGKAYGGFQRSIGRRSGKNYGAFYKSIGKRDGSSTNYYPHPSLPIRTGNTPFGDDDETQLSDQDIATLLTLNGISKKGNKNYGGFHKSVGKRDGSMEDWTGNPESYMSLDDFSRFPRGNHGGFRKSIGKRDGSSSNQYFSQMLPLQNRDKRTSARSIFAMNPINRIKKEADPNVSVQLLKILGDNEDEQRRLKDNLSKSTENVAPQSSSSGGQNNETKGTPRPNPAQEKDDKAHTDK